MAFDPIAEGASLVEEDFDPISHGASLVEEKAPLEKKKKGLFDFDVKKAEEEFSKTSGEALKAAPYVLQGAIKEPFKMANVLLPKKHQIPTDYDLAGKVSKGLSPEAIKESESLGGLLGMGLPRAGVMTGLKGLQSLPNIGNVIKKAMEASPILNKLFDFGGRGAEFGLYEAAEHPESQAVSGGLGFGLGAGLSGLTHGAPAIANKLGLFKKPGEEALKGIEYSQVAPAVEAGERLGRPVSPAEALSDPYLGGLQGRYARTQKASQENVRIGKENIQKEKEAINKLLDTIHDKSVTSNNKIRDLYQTAYKWNMKPQVVNQLKSDPLISDAFEAVSKDKAWQRKLEGKPENSFAYLDKVRKELSDQEGKLLRSGEKSKAAEYTDARNSLTDVMDNASPAYKKARVEAQKSIIRSQMEKKLKTGEIKGTEFYKKFIKNENKFNDLHSSLKNVPEAQKMLSDMKDSWHSLINVEKPSASSYQAEKAISQSRNYLDATLEMWNKLTGKKKNAEAIKFVKGDAWVKQLREAQKTGEKEKVENAINDIMMKILPVSDFLIEEKSK